MAIKVLDVECFFLLPPDYNGTISDALRKLAAYHEGAGLQNPERRRSSTIEGAARDERWDSFWQGAAVEGRIRFSGYMGVSEYVDNNRVSSVSGFDEP